MSKVAIYTQGCKVNQYESEAMAEAFAAAGFTPTEGEADVYVVNTCTVTAESDRKAGQLIRRLHKQSPHAPILVTGCYAQADPAAVAAIEGVCFVCGNESKLSLVKAAQKLLTEGRPAAPVVAVTDIDKAPFEPMCITRFDRTRAYVKIEDGCENRCAYCAIPGARGLVRSKPLADIVSEIGGLVAGGCREVVLTGIETASWGRDLGGVTLADLLSEVDGIAGIERIRLGSLYPTLITQDFAHRLGTYRHLTPHFHLSVQSGSSAVLAGMKRRYNREQALQAVRRIRESMPDAELTADFIVGFPGETEVDFADTLSFVKEVGFLQIHVFAYSKREGTPAARMPDQVPGHMKKARSAALIAAGECSRRERLELALQSPLRQVLFETYEHGMAIGHTEHFFEVAVPADHPMHGEIHPVRLLSIENGRLLAEIVRSI